MGMERWEEVEFCARTGRCPRDKRHRAELTTVLGYRGKRRDTSRDVKFWECANVECGFTHRPEEGK